MQPLTEKWVDPIKFDWTFVGTTEHIKAGDCIWSPPQKFGTCSVCIKLYPRGTKQSHVGKFGLYLRVIPSVLWANTWTLHDVTYEISFKDHRGQWECWSLKNDFTNNTPTFGWDEADTPKDDTFQFKVSLAGDFRREPPLKEDLPPAAQMWVSQKCTDVVISGGDGEGIKCHRAVLVSRSSVLETMLSSEFQEGKDQRIEMKNVSPLLLHTFVVFLYTDLLPDVTDCAELLRLADMYNIPKLLKICSDKMTGQVNSATVGEIASTFFLYRHAIDIEKAFGAVVSACSRDVAVLRGLVKYVWSMDGKDNLKGQVAQAVLHDDNLLNNIIRPLVTVEKLLTYF